MGRVAPARVSAVGLLPRVAPDGRPFWSAGLDCVRSNIQTYYEGLESALAWLPPRDGEFADAHGDGSFNYLAANFIRAFGPQDWHKRWATIVLGELRRIGFNTVGNWSEWEVASRARFPYVRPMSFRPSRVKTVFRDFPDVFDEAFARDAADYARQLAPTVEDPALVGYFLMNEPKWGFAALTPAEGMLLNTGECATREALARFLHERYPDDQALCRAWGIETTIEAVARGPWHHFFKTLSEACRAVDPNHLNLGARYHTVPPPWALAGMRCFDVFSINCYRERVPEELGEKIEAVVGRPVLIGEWHFGALDVGLPASGIGHVPSQADRGKAYRVYLEDAAAKPWCATSRPSAAATARTTTSASSTCATDPTNNSPTPHARATSVSTRWRPGSRNPLTTSPRTSRSCSIEEIGNGESGVDGAAGRGVFRLGAVRSDQRHRPGGLAQAHRRMDQRRRRLRGPSESQAPGHKAWQRGARQRQARPHPQPLHRTRTRRLRGAHRVHGAERLEFRRLLHGPLRGPDSR